MNNNNQYLPVYVSDGAIEARELLELKEDQLPADRPERWKKFKELLEGLRHVDEIGRSAGLAAALIMYRIREEGLYKEEIVVGEDGNPRPMTLPEFAKYCCNLGAGSSPASVSRNLRVAEYFLYLRAQGFVFYRGLVPAHLLPLLRVPMVHAPLLLGRAMEQYGEKMRECDVDAVVSSFLGEKPIKRESSFARLKREVGRMATTAISMAKAGKSDALIVQLEDIKGLVEVSPLKKPKKPGPKRLTVSTSREEATVELEGGSQIQLHGSEERCVIGPTILSLRGSEIMARHDPFDRANPPPTDAILRATGFAFHHGFLRKRYPSLDEARAGYQEMIKLLGEAAS